MGQLELSHAQLLKRGLCYIFEGIDCNEFLEKNQDRRTPLDAHPFGLEIPPRPEFSPFEGRMALLGFPGYTDESVECMIAHLRYFAVVGPYEGSQLNYLRVIHAQCDERYSDEHDIYYEASTHLGTFICGGCNDCSGGGGNGKLVMDSIFAIFSAAYNIEIENVTVSVEKNRRAWERLTMAYSARRA